MIQYKTSDKFNNILPDLTPLLDVLFILILFLLLTANILHKNIKIDLPKDPYNVAISAKTKSTNITLFNDGWSLADIRYKDLPSLEAHFIAIKSKNDRLKITIITDKKVPIERLVSLIALLKKHDVAFVNIKTAQE